MATNRDNSQDAELQQSRLTAYALDQLDDEERRQVETELQDDESARRTIEEVQLFSQALEDASEQEEAPPASTELRQAIMERLGSDKTIAPAVAWTRPVSRSRNWVGWIVAICLLLVAAPIGFWMSTEGMFGGGNQEDVASKQTDTVSEAADYASPTSSMKMASDESDATKLQGNASGPGWGEVKAREEEAKARTVALAASASDVRRAEQESLLQSRIAREQLAKFSADAKSTPAGPPLDAGGYYYDGRTASVDSYGGVRLATSDDTLAKSEFKASSGFDPYGRDGGYSEGEVPSNEQYDQIVENPFLPVNEQHARSTFSIDVDTASHANVRRFLTRNTLPPRNAVRIEEMVNYFSYDYPQPKGDIPFSVNMEVAECPWKPSNRLLRIGLKGIEIDRDERPASNIVFLLDVSGSMRSSDKLPLLQQAMKMLVRELTENDRVTIATYAGNAGLRLDVTTGDQQEKILQAIDSLSAGGSTHGSAGIKLAYEKAVENFIKEGSNRVILATDGDLNVGVTRDDELVGLIKDKAQSGVFLTVLGFGTGNLKDSKMEKLADNGNGVYAYIDSLREARKVLVEQITGSLVTIAKDVKIQLEFNPAEVESYRLIGYENRLLAREDFDDDTKDAGEIGAGHTVTALYELVPAGADAEEVRGGGALKYQKSGKPAAKKPEDLTDVAGNGELLTLWLRYKQPEGDKSRRLEFTLKDGGQKFNRSSHDFQFAASVASFGMLLRGSEHRGSLSYSAVEEIASSAIGKDLKGYRTEFVDLVRKASQLQR